MSTRTDAKSIGNNDAKSAEIAAGIRTKWLKASDEKKREIALDFKVGYIAGRDRLSISDAEAVMAEGKVNERNTKMISRAVSAFNYHVVNGKTKPAPQRHTRIQAHVREAATTFLAEFEGETLAEQIAQAIRVLQAMR